MKTNEPSTANHERIKNTFNGWTLLMVNLVLLVTGFVLLPLSVSYHLPPVFFLGMGLVVLGVILCCGFFTLQPNEARLMILFGAYEGTVRTSGFHWANPFFSRIRARIPLPNEAPVAQALKPGGQRFNQLSQFRTLSAKISLRTRNFNSKRLKVNDKGGNPIEIAVVVVWNVKDTAKAAFDVDDFESYVEIQSEGAIRHIASLYSYDHGEEQELTLRGSADEVTRALEQELQSRLDKAGLVIEETRLIHLAYAPEIAQVMLRRQQAEAVISARRKIVHGAVSMVEMALKELSEKEVVHLDEERKAAMVSNLLVVLCGDSEVKPVLNTGTLYA